MRGVPGTAPEKCRLCPATLMSFRTWQALPQWERAERRAKGQRPHMGRGLCRDCYSKDRYVPRPRRTAPKQCSKCPTVMIPNCQWYAADSAQRKAWRAEGKGVHFGRGMCSKCYNRERRVGLHVGDEVRGEVERLKLIGLSPKQIASELDLDLDKVRRLVA